MWHDEFNRFVRSFTSKQVTSERMDSGRYASQECAIDRLNHKLHESFQEYLYSEDSTSWRANLTIAKP